MTYVGSFVNGRFEEEGILKTKNGHVYQGTFTEGRPSGEGRAIIMQNDEVAYNGKVLNGRMVDLDANDIGSLKFFNLLYGIGNGDIFGSSQTVLSSYLSLYFQNDPEALEVVARLNQSHALALLTPEERLSQVSERLQNNQPCLLSYGYNRHAMMLNLVPGKNEKGSYIDCEIFNSGDGLNAHHKQDPKSKKYQTMKTIRTYEDSLDVKLAELLAWQEFNNVDKAYHAIENVFQSEIIEQENPLYQRGQISGNCGMECVFAFLRNKLPPEKYAKMRKDLFVDSLVAVTKQNPQMTDSILKQPRVQHKVDKLPEYSIRCHKKVSQMAIRGAAPIA